MTMPNSPIDDQALDWIIRLRDPAFDRWEAFELWLAADPAHADAYQAMAVADADLDAIFAAEPATPRPMPASNDPSPGLRRRRIPARAWLGSAVAASLAVVVGTAVFERRADPYVIETPAGVTRVVVLADGSRLDINGGTRIELDRRHDREAVLTRGEVLFSVVHDANRPFEVAVGGARLVDVGTVFNVVREAGVTEVGVAEGAVVFNPELEEVKLAAGRGLRAVDGEQKLQLSDRAPGDFGAWRRGQLVYDGDPLARVAADLTRNLGVPVTADAAVAGRPFRGVISLGNRDPVVVMPGLGPLLDVSIVKQGGGWRLVKTLP
jgi:transmembrane sensor